MELRTTAPAQRAPPALRPLALPPARAAPALPQHHQLRGPPPPPSPIPELQPRSETSPTNATNPNGSPSSSSTSATAKGSDPTAHAAAYASSNLLSSLLARRTLAQPHLRFNFDYASHDAFYRELNEFFAIHDHPLIAASERAFCRAVKGPTAYSTANANDDNDDNEEDVEDDDVIDLSMLQPVAVSSSQQGAVDPLSCWHRAPQGLRELALDTIIDAILDHTTTHTLAGPTAPPVADATHSDIIQHPELTSAELCLAYVCLGAVGPLDVDAHIRWIFHNNILLFAKFPHVLRLIAKRLLILARQLDILEYNSAIASSNSDLRFFRTEDEYAAAVERATTHTSLLLAILFVLLEVVCVRTYPFPDTDTSTNRDNKNQIAVENLPPMPLPTKEAYAKLGESFLEVMVEHPPNSEPNLCTAIFTLISQLTEPSRKQFPVRKLLWVSRKMISCALGNADEYIQMKKLTRFLSGLSPTADPSFNKFPLDNDLDSFFPPSVTKRMRDSSSGDSFYTKLTVHDFLKFYHRQVHAAPHEFTFVNDFGASYYLNNSISRYPGSYLPHVSRLSGGVINRRTLEYLPELIEVPRFFPGPRISILEPDLAPTAFSRQQSDAFLNDEAETLFALDSARPILHPYIGGADRTSSRIENLRKKSAYALMTKSEKEIAASDLYWMPLSQREQLDIIAKNLYIPVHLQQSMHEMGRIDGIYTRFNIVKKMLHKPHDLGESTWLESIASAENDTDILDIMKPVFVKFVCDRCKRIRTEDKPKYRNGCLLCNFDYSLGEGNDMSSRASTSSISSSVSSQASLSGSTENIAINGNQSGTESGGGKDDSKLVTSTWSSTIRRSESPLKVSGSHQHRNTDHVSKADEDYILGIENARASVSKDVPSLEILKEIDNYNRKMQSVDEILDINGKYVEKDPLLSSPIETVRTSTMRAAMDRKNAYFKQLRPDRPTIESLLQSVEQYIGKMGVKMSQLEMDATKDAILKTYQRIRLVDIIYSLALPTLPIQLSMVVRLLYFLNVEEDTIGSPQSEPGAPSTPWYCAPNLKRNETISTWLDRLDFARHKEVVTKTASAILLESYQLSRISHGLRADFISHILADNNCAILIIKILSIWFVNTKDIGLNQHDSSPNSDSKWLKPPELPVTSAGSLFLSARNEPDILDYFFFCRIRNKSFLKLTEDLQRLREESEKPDSGINFAEELEKAICFDFKVVDNTGVAPNNPTTVPNDDENALFNFDSVGSVHAELKRVADYDIATKFGLCPKCAELYNLTLYLHAIADPTHHRSTPMELDYNWRRKVFRIVTQKRCIPVDYVCRDCMEVAEGTHTALSPNSINYKGRPIKAQTVPSSFRNFFSSITLLRVLQKITKGNALRVQSLISWKSSVVLKRVLKTNHPQLQLFALKLLKSQLPLLGSKFRSNAMRIISLMYMRLRPYLLDDSLSAVTPALFDTREQRPNVGRTDLTGSLTSLTPEEMHSQRDRIKRAMIYRHHVDHYPWLDHEGVLESTLQLGTGQLASATSLSKSSTGGSRPQLLKAHSDHGPEMNVLGDSGFADILSRLGEMESPLKSGKIMDLDGNESDLLSDDYTDSDGYIYTDEDSDEFLDDDYKHHSFSSDGDDFEDGDEDDDVQGEFSEYNSIDQLETFGDLADTNEPVDDLFDQVAGDDVLSEFDEDYPTTAGGTTNRSSHRIVSPNRTRLQRMHLQFSDLAEGTEEGGDEVNVAITARGHVLLIKPQTNEILGKVSRDDIQIDMENGNIILLDDSEREKNRRRRLRRRQRRRKSMGTASTSSNDNGRGVGGK